MPAHMIKRKSMEDCVGPECPGCTSTQCMSEGGPIIGIRQPNDEQGVHRQAEGQPAGVSHMGQSVRRGDYEPAKRVAIDKRKEARNIVSSDQGYAKGGEVDEPEMESELHDMLGSELLGAIERKDHKQIWEGLEAMVLSIMSKGMEDESV